MTVLKAFLRLERDIEYRPRVLRASDGLTRDHARYAMGTSLDAIGDLLGVQRRIVEDEG